MKIAFFWPSDYAREETVPIVWGLLYDRIRDFGHDVRLFNLSLEGWAPDEPQLLREVEAMQPDLVCLTGWPTTVASMFETADAMRPLLPRATFVMGGTYATLNPHVAYDLGRLDYVLCGEAEKTFPLFVQHLAAGDVEAIAQLPGIYFRRPDGGVVQRPAQRQASLDDMGEVDWEFLRLRTYFERGYMRTAIGARYKAPLFATRGCPYSCHFCTVPLVHGKATRHWSPELIAARIQHLYDTYQVRHINFMDDNPTQHMEQWKAVLRAIIALGLRDLVLETYRGVRLERLDPEMLGLMRQAGFQHITIAPESGSDAVRDLMQKSMKRDAIVSAARMIREAGLGLQGFFLVAFPGETAPQRQQTYRFIRELRFDLFKIHQFLPLPGTAAFQLLADAGVVPATYTPRGFLLGSKLPNFNGDPPERIEREILWMYASFYAMKPWKVTHLLRGSPLIGIQRAVRGLLGGLLAPALRLFAPAGGGTPAAAPPSPAPPLRSTATFCVGAGVPERAAADGHGPS